MKHKYTFILAFFLFSLLFMGIKEVNADTLNVQNDYSVTLLNDTAEEVCEGLLGPNLKKDLQSVLKIIRILGPILVVFLTSFEFITAVTSKDEDAIKKCSKKLVTRLILVVVLFFLPVLLDLLLSFLDSKYTTCIN